MCPRWKESQCSTFSVSKCRSETFCFAQPCLPVSPRRFGARPSPHPRCESFRAPAPSDGGRSLPATLHESANDATSFVRALDLGETLGAHRPLMQKALPSPRGSFWPSPPHCLPSTQGFPAPLPVRPASGKGSVGRRQGLMNSGASV